MYSFRVVFKISEYIPETLVEKITLGFSPVNGENMLTIYLFIADNSSAVIPIEVG